MGRPLNCHHLLKCTVCSVSILQTKRKEKKNNADQTFITRAMGHRNYSCVTHKNSKYKRQMLRCLLLVSIFFSAPIKENKM